MKRCKVVEEDAVQEKHEQLAREEVVVESQEVVVAIKSRIVVIVVKFRNILLYKKIIYFTIYIMSDPYSEEDFRESYGSYEQGSSGPTGDQMDVLNSTGAMAYGGRRRRSRKNCGGRKRKTNRRKSRGGRRHKKTKRRR
jgi:hypothetical protein